MITTTISAYAVKHRGGRAEPFSYERTLGDSDVLVKITHCSVARGDVQFIDDEWGDARFPLVPGHEMLGVVEAAGAAVTSLMAGDLVGWLESSRVAGLDRSLRQALERVVGEELAAQDDAREPPVTRRWCGPKEETPWR